MLSNSTRCTFKKTISEYKLETFLLDNLDDFFHEYLLLIKTDKKKNVSKKRYSAIKLEMDNLNYMFRKGRISAVDYDRDFIALEKELASLDILDDAPPPELSSNWKDSYYILDKNNRRAFWRTIIKDIIIDYDRNISVVFV